MLKDFYRRHEARGEVVRSFQRVYTIGRYGLDFLSQICPRHDIILIALQNIHSMNALSEVKRLRL